jgi:hypothetical protein
MTLNWADAGQHPSAMVKTAHFRPIPARFRVDIGPILGHFSQQKRL